MLFADDTDNTKEKMENTGIAFKKNTVCQKRPSSYTDVRFYNGRLSIITKYKTDNQKMDTKSTVKNKKSAGLF